MPKFKTMKFKSDKVHCEVCFKIFNVNKYIIKNPMFLSKGRPIKKSQTPKHKCKENK